jgi:hypothetical protein
MGTVPVYAKTERIGRDSLDHLILLEPWSGSVTKTSKFATSPNSCLCGQISHLLGQNSLASRLSVYPPQGYPVPPGQTPAYRSEHAPVAQLDRATASEAVGRTFESCRVRHFRLA